MDGFQILRVSSGEKSHHVSGREKGKVTILKYIQSVLLSLQSAAQPAVAHVGHVQFFSDFADTFLRLAL